MQARLFCRTGEFAGRTHRLADDTVIGRSGEADVMLDSKLISKLHARIYAEEGTYFLEDLDSSNGTWLDGIRVREPVKLGRLNVITFAGTLDFVFQVEVAPLDATTPGPQAEEGELASLEADEDLRTRADLEDFQPLPELEEPGTEESVAQSVDGSFEEVPGPDAADEHRTEIDFDDFAPLPELEQSEAEGPAAPSIGDPSQKDSTPDAPDDEHRTEIDVEDFTPLPDLEQPGAAKPTGEEEAVARYGLEVTFPDGRRDWFDLEEGSYTLGRGGKCDVSLNDPSVSRHHATLTVGETVMLEDAGSRNGTRLEGREISEAEIRPGSVFTLGLEVEVKLVKR